MVWSDSDSAIYSLEVYLIFWVNSDRDSAICFLELYLILLLWMDDDTILRMDHNQVFPFPQLGTDVRTVIKARAPPSTNMKTISTFRASRKHHMVSLATAIVPSPDWFLGVANLELCDAKTHEWANNVIFNLYPMDAGTDSGKKFDVRVLNNHNYLSIFLVYLLCYISDPNG